LSKKWNLANVKELAGGPIFIGAEEDAFETLDETAVVSAVLWKLQELEQLGGSLKVNGKALLLHG